MGCFFRPANCVGPLHDSKFSSVPAVVNRRERGFSQRPRELVFGSNDIATHYLSDCDTGKDVLGPTWQEKTRCLHVDQTTWGDRYQCGLPQRGSRFTR